jgi:hypothetical protein
MRLLLDEFQALLPLVPSLERHLTILTPRTLVRIAARE